MKTDRSSMHRGSFVTAQIEFGGMGRSTAPMSFAIVKLASDS